VTAPITRITRQDVLAARRACAICGSRLSAYNERDTCFSHTVELPWKGPNTKPR
jgi:threonine dehydrogenase-like Zn-dependent dehydrogenase